MRYFKGQELYLLSISLINSLWYIEFVLLYMHISIISQTILRPFTNLCMHLFLFLGYCTNTHIDQTILWKN